MEMDNTRGKSDNERAVIAAKDPQEKEKFLIEERIHILRMASKLLGRGITESDDEWSIALIATSDAIDTYNIDQGDFWGYASIVIKNRLTDYLRKEYRIREHESAVSPEAFSGDLPDKDNATGIELEVSRKESKEVVENDLKNEIDALREELKAFGIGFRDLADASPKSEKTREACEKAVLGMFDPPPLVEGLRRKKEFPIKEIFIRTDVKKKTLERHRKHLVAATLVMDGDYPKMQEYFPYSRRHTQENTQEGER